uniref:Yippee domain-containing protein n=1 Tax=Takifugu rubripes TaxID=31033 RepID=A0A674ME73_TAKRU
MLKDGGIARFHKLVTLTRTLVHSSHSSKAGGSAGAFTSFQGSQGRAYLFNSVVNVGCGPAEERVLLTGLHAVADIYCENCKTTLGWKYVRDIHQIYFLLLCLEALFCNRPCVLVTHDRIPEGQIMCCGRSEHRGCSY